MPMKKIPEYALERKEDIWGIPAETRVLRINCKLTEHAAVKIIVDFKEAQGRVGIELPPGMRKNAKYKTTP